MLDNVKAIISDMDGVLWRGNQPLPGLDTLFSFLQSANMPFILATNNSRKTPDDYVYKLSKLGIVGVQPHHVVTSGTATASYLRKMYPAGTKLYVVGGDGFKQILVHSGFVLVEDDAEVVVCGIDFDLTYAKMRTATLNIRAGAPFVGTNPDTSFPSPEGLVPGTGSLLALIATASDVSPTIIGKPERGMFDSALETLGTLPEETLMIGDRINTDIAGAKAIGIQTALVMTGVETEDSLQASDVKPDRVFAGLPELVAALQSAQA